MKNTTLTVTFNTEKLDALTFHMEKREADLQTELNDTVQRLYEKYVPPRRLFTIRFFFQHCVNSLPFCIVFFFFGKERTAEKASGFGTLIKKNVEVSTLVGGGEQILVIGYKKKGETLGFSQ